MQLLGKNDTCHALRICEEQGLIDEEFSRDLNEGRPAMGKRHEVELAQKQILHWVVW